MSSRYEGLPMVLLEAQAFGLPVVSFCCKCGPSDIIENGVNGYLVEEGNVSALALRMKDIMSDIGLRRKMSKNAIIKSKNFSVDSVMSHWINLFDSLVLK